MTKNKKSKRQRITDFANMTWVLNNLTNDELDQADAMEFDLERFGEWLDMLIERDGMEFKFGWDNYSSTWQATLMGAWQGFRNSGYALSARSSAGFADCARLVVFKYDTICVGDMPAVAGEVKEARKRG